MIRTAVVALACAGAAVGLTACQPSEYDYSHHHSTVVHHTVVHHTVTHHVVVHHVVTHHTVSLRKGRR